MAWNPSPEVAAVRDVARKLNADRTIVFFTRPDEKCGYVSYGETKDKCGEAKRMADAMWSAFQDAMEEQL